MSFTPDCTFAENPARKDEIYSEILYIAENSFWGRLGYEAVSAAFRSAIPIYWSPGMPKPDLTGWRGSWIISFKSDLVLPRGVLEHAKKGAINFHPSPPKYRGVGGYWWALHNNDDVFGVTCHHMNERIDHGPIIAIESFPILQGETVESLKHRAATHSLELLNITLNDIVDGKSLTPCGVEWGSHLYTYRELAQTQSMNAANGNHNTIDVMQALKALGAVMQEFPAMPSEQTTKMPASNNG